MSSIHPFTIYFVIILWHLLFIEAFASWQMLVTYLLMQWFRAGLIILMYQGNLYEIPVCVNLKLETVQLNDILNCFMRVPISTSNTGVMYKTVIFLLWLALLMFGELPIWKVSEIPEAASSNIVISPSLTIVCMREQKSAIFSLAFLAARVKGVFGF